jgi:hypothetical protein
VAHLWFTRKGEARSLLSLYRHRKDLNNFVTRDIAFARHAARIIQNVYLGAAVTFGALSVANAQGNGPKAPAALLFGLPIVCLLGAIPQRRAITFHTEIIDLHSHNRSAVLPFLERTAGLRP